MARRSLWRRVERWLVGAVMAVFAITLERVVLRSLRKKGEGTEPDPQAIRSRGGDVSLDDRG